MQSSGQQSVLFLWVPKDNDNPPNHIGNAWQWNAGAATDDAETNPAGDGTNGDGFSRYEEYRGFIVWDSHTRTDPTRKTMFVADLTAFGDLGYFPEAALPDAYRIRSSERRADDQSVNFNYESHHVRDCFAMDLVEGMLEPGRFGECYGPVWQANSEAVIDRYQIQEAVNDPEKNTYGHSYAATEDRVIGHELGHSILWHQNWNNAVPSNHGHHDGTSTQDCLMWKYTDLTRAFYPDFCVANPGCATLWKVKP